MSSQLKFMVVREGHRGIDIGAIGFVGDKAAVVLAFFDDRDADLDGSVSLGEHFTALALGGLEGKALTQVVMQSRGDPDIMMRDSSLGQLQGEVFTHFALGLITQSAFVDYFNGAIRRAGNMVGTRIATGTVKSYMIRKGCEAAVRRAAGR